jgi:hypothetical protein
MKTDNVLPDEGSERFELHGRVPVLFSGTPYFSHGELGFQQQQPNRRSHEANVQAKQQQPQM